MHGQGKPIFKKMAKQNYHVRSPLQAGMPCIWKAASSARDEDNLVGKSKAIKCHCGTKDKLQLRTPTQVCVRSGRN